MIGLTDENLAKIKADYKFRWPEQYATQVQLLTDIIIDYEVESSYLEKPWKKGEILHAILVRRGLTIKTL